MRTLLKIILLFILHSTSLFANTQRIDECKNDLYYANGIMIKESKFDARLKWIKKAKELLSSNPQEFKKIGKMDIAYNVSQGFFNDMYESLEQLISNEWGWEKFSNYFRTYLEVKGYQDWVDEHRPNLETQINAYKKSIKLGHGIIVVAHSQGNYYTNEAYENLDDWMKDYFHMIGVATPANHVAGFAVGDASAPYVKFHNDFINSVVTSLPSNLNDTRHHGFPSIDTHDFYESYMKEETSKKIIHDFIIDNIQKHSKADSQWETDQELNKDTKDYKITVKHRFDSSITSMQDIEVYPFNPSQKLYHVIDNTGGNGWVKASCGGKEVFDYWDNKKDNEAYLINNIEKEVILSKFIPKIIGMRFNLYRGNTYYSSGTVPIMIPNNVSDLVDLEYGSYGDNGISQNSTLAVIYRVSYNTWTGTHGGIYHDFLDPTFLNTYYDLKEHNFNVPYQVMVFRNYSEEYLKKYPLYFTINNSGVNFTSDYIDQYDFNFHNTGTIMVGALIKDYTYFQSYIKGNLHNIENIDLKI